MRLLAIARSGSGILLGKPILPNLDASVVYELQARNILYRIDTRWQEAKRMFDIPANVDGLHLEPEQAVWVRQFFLRDKEWKEAAAHAMRYAFGRDCCDENVLHMLAGQLPWWSEFVTACQLPFWQISYDGKKHRYVDPKVLLLGEDIIKPSSWGVMHSYAVQLMRTTPAFQGGMRPVVVMGCTVTSDYKMVYGVRAGPYLSGAHVLVPAGSAKWPLSIEQAFLGELQEELGITETDIQGKPRCIGIIELDDARICVLYFTKLHISFDIVKERWSNAKDRDEHSALVRGNVPWVYSDSELVAENNQARIPRFTKAVTRVVESYMRGRVLSPTPVADYIANL